MKTKHYSRKETLSEIRQKTTGKYQYSSTFTRVQWVLEVLAIVSLFGLIITALWTICS